MEYKLVPVSTRIPEMEQSLAKNLIATYKDAKLHKKFHKDEDSYQLGYEMGFKLCLIGLGYEIVEK
ncbi:hypothetical protein MHI11_20690 [Bacillus sp. FSL K6-3312]|uniref:hypothetical protein n=1 Tax=Bacillus sp. FSL K6-3312 TaxID=2921499 RepID=UPI0030FCA252